MKHNLNQATFIIPVRIESPDRLRNVVTSIAFLLENFHTNIIVKEVDKESIFHRDALPLLESVLDQQNIFTNFNFKVESLALRYRRRNGKALAPIALKASVTALGVFLLAVIGSIDGSKSVNHSLNFLPW